MLNDLKDLHLLLAGPFVIYDDEDTDSVRVLIPDLMDTHYKPGLTATDNSVELDNGVWTINPGKPQTDAPKSKLKGPPLKTEHIPLDTFCCPLPSSFRAYAVLKLPKPDSLVGISPVTAEITSGGEDGTPKQKVDTFATRAVLIYQSVDLGKVTVSPDLVWNPGGGSRPILYPAGPVGLLVCDMRPIDAPTDDEHARMVYRNMARMLGVDRYMRQLDSMADGGRNILRGKYNDCGAAMMLVSAPKS
jgi:hypothetical protein